MRLPALLALALAVLLAGCIATPQPEALPPAADASTLAPPTEVLEFTTEEVTLLALPVVGGSAEVQYDVPAGAKWLGATLTWQTRGTALTLTGTDPEGTEQGQSKTLAGSGPRSPARLDWWIADPAMGAWTFTIAGQAALQEPVRLQLHTAKAVQGMHVAQETAVPPGGFAEVNTEMKAGETFTYEWTSATPVYFNIHTHRDGVTTNVVEETTDAMRATFTAEEDGGYSLLWALDGGQVPLPSGNPVPLTYRVDGQYQLHSAVG